MSVVFIRICALLIGVRSLTNFAKLFQGDEAVLVFFGHILHGRDGALPAAVIGLFMLVTAVAMWKPSTWALPLSVVYAAYVIVNLLTWTVTNPGEMVHVGARLSSATDPSQLRLIGALGFLGYCIVAIGTTAGPAWLLWKRRQAEH